VRVDVVLAAEVSDRVDRLRRGERQAHRLLAAADLLQRPELGPPAEHEAAVATARPAAANVRLHEDDVERRVVLLEADRGPEAGVAAADDADVGALLALQPGRVFGSLQSLFQPEASHAPTVVDSGVRENDAT
jgi:hypothetical protein